MSCTQSSMPCWFTPIPRYNTKEDEESSLGWSQRKLVVKEDKGDVTRKYLQEKVTGTLTRGGDTLDVIAQKCTGIFIGCSLYCAAAMACNVLFTLPIGLVNLCLDVIHGIGEQFKKGTPLDSLIVLGKALCWDLPKTLLYVIWTIVRAPIFTIGVMFTGLYGIFFPLQGRKLVAAIEYEWHDRLPYTMDLRHHCDELKKESQGEECLNIFKGGFLFLAYCFQPVGNISDPKFKNPPPKNPAPKETIQES